MENNINTNAGSRSDKLNLTAAFLVAVLAGFISQVISYSYNYAYAYRDAIYRMEAARRFFDSLTPGIYSQLGTVWLPIPNLILMPLAAIDYLWETGLAASIVNLPAFIIASLAIFLIVKNITESFTAAWFGFLVFVFNYNILYFQTTAMTEQLYLTFLICSVYYLVMWSKRNKGNYLLYSSIFAAFGIGTRYDAWPVALVTIFLVFIISFRNRNKEDLFRNTILIGAMPIFFMFVWLMYNWFRYGDPLEFSRGQFSTLYQLKYYEERGRLLTKNDFWLSAKVYFSSVFLYSGVIYTALGFAGLAIYTFVKKLSLKSLPVYIFWIALPATLFLLYKGQLIIELPNSIPPGYFNSRYGLYLYPAIAVFSGITAYYLLKFRYKFPVYLLLGGILVYQQFLFFEKFPENIPAIDEAVYSYSKPSENLSLYLKNNYKGGKILYDNIIFALHPWTGIDLKDRINYYTFAIAEQVRTTPSKYVEWVLIYKNAGNDKIYESVKDNPDFQQNFELKFSEYGVEAYEKKH